MLNSRFFLLAVFAVSHGFLPASNAEVFQLPTANRAIFSIKEQEKYFVGTIGRTWNSGTFGCVRSEGWQMHEGIDIRCIQRDRSGEPIDPVLATAAGTVAYVNRKPSLSNYGNYVILRHRIDGMEIFSNYAHLREIRSDLRAGLAVKAGERIGTMGRTANTREGISKDRAHLHFELNFFINDHFSTWYKRAFPGQRNDHGDWNGQNLVAIDPRLIFLKQRSHAQDFNLLSFIRGQTELCRILVRDSQFPWLKRYPGLVVRNPAAEKQGIAGYEVSLNYNGLPFKLVPRSASEMKKGTKYQLLTVNAEEYQKNPCRKLVTRRGSSWELASAGVRLLDLLTHD